MLINLTNHPYAKWSEKQKEVAIKDYGDIIDLPFPSIPPEWSEGEVANLVETYFAKIQEFAAQYNSIAVHLMGEMNFCFALVSKLCCAGITCVASTTKRIVNLMESGEKVVAFDFIQFREYIM